MDVARTWPLDWSSQDPEKRRWSQRRNWQEGQLLLSSMTEERYFVSNNRIVTSHECTHEDCWAEDDAGGAVETVVVTVVDGSACDDGGAALLEAGGACELEGAWVGAAELLGGGAEEEGGSGDADDEGGEEVGAGVSDVEGVNDGEGDWVGVGEGSGLSYTMSLGDKAGCRTYLQKRKLELHSMQRELPRMLLGFRSLLRRRTRGLDA
jgi:hypothetical protein